MNEKDFLDELKYCIGKNDTVKAAALLQFFPDLGEKSQKKVLYEILRADDRIAYPMLEQLSRVTVENPAVMESITELIYEKSYNNAELIADYIRKSNHENKILYIRIAGDLKLRETIDCLEDILLNGAELDEIEAAITALGRIGDQSSAGTLGKFLHLENPKLRLAAVNALTEIGGPTAIKKLCESMVGNDAMDLVIIETFALLQDQLSLEKLVELLSSQFVDLRNSAIDKLIEIGPKAIPVVVENLKSDDSDTVIHCLNILGNIGDITALPAILRLLRNEPKNANVRFAIYEALERLPSSKSAISLAEGLCDPVESVSMAAAKAIDKNLSTVLIAGLRNLIDADDAQSRRIVGTLIDSGADNAFNFLLDSKIFQKYAIAHLTETAHPDIVHHFIRLLKKKGEKNLINKIRQALKEDEKPKVRIVAVDDSKMMLKIYMRKLHDMGFESDTFEFPAEAVHAVKSAKPDLVITDLNMPEMNGIQMSEEIRKIYGPEALPIIMITTQSDIAGQSMTNEGGKQENVVRKAGINAVLNKPFNDIELKETIIGLLNL